MGILAYIKFVQKFSRGGMSQQTWKPQVTPVGEMPTKPTPEGQVFTKTSLAATKQVRQIVRTDFVFVHVYMCNLFGLHSSLINFHLLQLF